MEELEQDEMSFWDHLEELRWTLFRSILALFVFAIGSFAFMRDIFNHVITAPCRSDFILYQWLLRIKPMDDQCKSLVGCIAGFL